jgi:hypothetical protein
MSIKIMSWVFDHSPYDGKARLVHAVLADHANDQGICWPSQATIAKRAGCSVEHVRVTVKQMIADGYLEIVQQSTRQGDSHRYKLLVPNSLGVPKSDGEGPQVETPTSPNPSPSNHQEPSNNPHRVQCPYCKRVYKVDKPHNCSAMNMLMR